MQNGRAGRSRKIEWHSTACGPGGKTSLTEKLEKLADVEIVAIVDDGTSRST